MKIIHCLNQYMPMVFAGTEVYTHTLATMQKSSGHDVAVVIPHIDYYRPGLINEHYLYDKIDVFQYLETANPTSRQIHYGYEKPAGLENFKQLILTLKPDIIHFHELNRSIGFTTEHVKIAKQYGAKIFLTLHLSSYTCNTNILVKDGKLCNGIIEESACTTCCYKTLFNVPPMLASPLTAISILFNRIGITKRMFEGKVTTLMMVPATIERVKKELKELVDHLDQFVCYAKWFEKILLENGVPKNKITVVPAALVSIEKRKVNRVVISTKLPIKMVFIGRIQQTKGIHLIIEAMKQFSAGQVQIDIYGRPEETAYYSKCINDSIGIGNITWRGFINREDVTECLMQYDIFCLPSTFSEMSPLVIQEAFAAGIPVLASKVYGNMEQIIDQHNGILFEFNSAISLENKIKLLISNPALVEQMKNNIVVPLHFNEVHESYLRLYASC